MTNTLGRQTLYVLIGCSLLLILLGVLASDGFFILDEFIYFSAAQSFHDTRGFAIANGFEQFGSEDLRLWLLVDGPSGLVSQYPVGATLAGAMLLGVFGQKTLIALNVVAAIGTLIFTYALARRLFPGRFVGELAVALLTFCTFWTEYVVGHWPHSISMLSVTAAIFFFVTALDREKSASLPALAAGAAIGLGVMFRLEGVLALPAIAILTIIYARAPVKVLVSGLVGLAPFAAAIVWSNFARFGSLNPLSYGSTGGGTDLTSYWMLGVCMLLALAGLVTLRIKGSVRLMPLWFIGGAAFAVLCVILSPQLSAFAVKLAKGFHSLIIDATALSDPRSGVQSGPDGTLSFWGLPKKALGQSLPWLGCLALLFGLQWQRQRRSVVIALTICLIWSLPFLMRSWHGGLGLNMRYFLPLLPLLASLCAFLVAHHAGRIGYRTLVAGVAMGLVFSAMWQASLSTSVAEFHQITTVRVLMFVAFASLVAGFFPHRSSSGLALAAIGFGTGVAMLLAFQDWTISQSRRAVMASLSENTRSLEGSFVFYGVPEAHSYALRNPDHLIALPDRISDEVDANLIASACATGFRVLIPSGVTLSNPGLSLLQTKPKNQQNDIIAGYAEADCASTLPEAFEDAPDSGS